jgi:predicted HTH domain antitoxin
VKLVVELEIPDGAIDVRSEREFVRSVKEQTALRLYSEERVTTGEAAAMLGMTRIEFLDLLRQTGGEFITDLDREDFEQLRRAHATGRPQSAQYRRSSAFISGS